MPLQGSYPNSVYKVDLVGSKRTEYMSALAGLYNDLNGKGYPVPLASVVDEGLDTSYVKCEGVSGDSLGDLVSSGVVSSAMGMDVYGRALAKLKKMKLDEGLTVYNMHQGKICYDVERDRFMICDFSRNSAMDVFGRVEGFTSEHIEELRLKSESEAAAAGDAE